MSERLNNDINNLLEAFDLEENVPKSEILSPEEIDKLLSLIAESEDDSKGNKIFYPSIIRDFRTIDRLTKEDFDANEKFLKSLAEELKKGFEKKYAQYFKNIQINMVDFTTNNFDKSLSYFTYTNVVTSFLWNKRYAAFGVKEKTIFNLMYKNNTEISFEEFRSRNFTKKEIVFYKKNIERLFIKSLIKTCKKTKCFNNTLNHSKIVKKKFIRDLEGYRYCFPIEDYEGMMLYFIDITTETTCDEFECFSFNFAFDWRVAKQISMCINGKKGKEYKSTQINEIDKLVKVQLGNTKMSQKEIKNLKRNDFIELDDTNGIVDIVVDNKVIAKGEVSSIKNEEEVEKYLIRVREVL